MDRPSTGWLGRDHVVTIGLGTAAVVSIVMLAVSATSMMARPPSDPAEVLRLAARQYIDGDTIVAGELAETVDLGEEFPLPSEIPWTLDPPDDATQSSDGKAPPGLQRAPNLQVGPDPEPPSDPMRPWRTLKRFLIGAGHIARARSTSDDRGRRTHLRNAVTSLSLSKRGGFPRGRVAEGNKLLGEALLELGRYDEAIGPLADAVADDPTLGRAMAIPRATALSRAAARSSATAVSDASLASDGPNTRGEAALVLLDDLLADATLTRDRRRDASLLKIQTLFGLNRGDQARAIVEHLDQPSDDPVSNDNPDKPFRDRIQLWTAIGDAMDVGARSGTIDLSVVGPDDIDRKPEWTAGRRQQYAQAVEQLRDVSLTATSDVGHVARLWLARTHRVAGKFETALTVYTEVRNRRPIDGVAIAAGVEALGLQTEMGLSLEATQTIGYLIGQIEDAAGFDESELSMDHFRDAVLDAIAALRRNGDFADATEASKQLSPLFERTTSLIEIGRTEVAHADSMVRTGSRKRAPPRAVVAKARQRYREGGRALAEAAERSFDTPNYVPLLWESIEALREGRDHGRVIELSNLYLRYEDRSRRGQGLTALGQSLLAIGQRQRAIETLHAAIIEQPRDPLRYDARLLLAAAYAESGDDQRAEATLNENLNDGTLTPDSPAWRQSLLDLTTLTYRRAASRMTDHGQDPAAKPNDAPNISTVATGTTDNVPESSSNNPSDRELRIRRDLDSAMRLADQAIRRYWPDVGAVAALYQSGRCHILAAQLGRQRARRDDLQDAARRTILAEADSHDRQAAEQLTRLRDHLIAVEDDRRLTQDEQIYLRNASLMRADRLLAVGMFEEAAEAYRGVEIRNLNAPISLEAILRRRECLLQLGRRDAAALLIRQAQSTLTQIPPRLDAEFEQLTRYDRARWAAYLTWLSSDPATDST